MPRPPSFRWLPLVAGAALALAACDRGTAAPTGEPSPGGAVLPGATAPPATERVPGRSAQLTALMQEEARLLDLAALAAATGGGATGAFEVPAGPSLASPSEAGTTLLRQRHQEAKRRAGRRWDATFTGMIGEEALLAPSREGGAVWRRSAFEAPVAAGGAYVLVWAVGPTGVPLWARVTWNDVEGKRLFTLTRSTLADGGEKVLFTATYTPNPGTELASSWTRLLAASGNVSGAGVCSWARPDGQPQTLPVAFSGTVDRWTGTVREPGASEPLAVTLMPEDGVLAP